MEYRLEHASRCGMEGATADGNLAQGMPHDKPLETRDFVSNDMLTADRSSNRAVSTGHCSTIICCTRIPRYVSIKHFKDHSIKHTTMIRLPTIPSTFYSNLRDYPTYTMSYSTCLLCMTSFLLHNPHRDSLANCHCYIQVTVCQYMHAASRRHPELRSR